MEAWKALFDRLTKHEHETELFILDNEFSTELKTTLKLINLEYKLVPPNVHQKNAAK